MADGIFTIKPRWLSDITCTLGESTTIKYVVLSSTIDWNEAERVKVAYASGGQGGSASGEQRGLVGCKFNIEIFGTDQADAMSGLRTITQALTNPDGGYIQYRPRGLGATVLSTYYHYLQSGPPSIRGQGSVSDYAPAVGQTGRTHPCSIRCQCNVIIKAWATSDPKSPVTIKAATSIENFTDDSNVNYVVVESSLIKGDAILPIIRYDRTDSESQLIASMFCHRKRMVISNEDVRDFVDSEDMPFGSEIVDASVCGGHYERISNTGGSQILPAYWLNNIDKTYFGKVSPILCAKTSGEYTAEIDIAQTAAIVDQTSVITIDNSNWKLYMFSQLDFPVVSLPDYVADADADNWFLVTYVDLEVVETSSGDLDVDFLWLPNIDHWITNISSIDKDSTANSLDTGDDLYLDAMTGLVYKGSPLAGSLISIWNVDGESIDIILEKGFDHRISFLASDENDVYRHAFEADVTIYGFYLTMFPFETA